MDIYNNPQFSFQPMNPLDSVEQGHQFSEMMIFPLPPLSNTQIKPRKHTTFLYKLYEVLEDPRYNQYIFWLPCGTAFGFYSTDEFRNQILSIVFNQVTELSFVRQLNMYGFTKVDRAAKMSAKNATTLHSYKNPFFLRGRMDLLSEISRKVPMKNTVKDLTSIVSQNAVGGSNPYKPNLPSDPATNDQVTLLNKQIADLEAQLLLYYNAYTSQKIMLENMGSYFPVQPTRNDATLWFEPLRPTMEQTPNFQ